MGSIRQNEYPDLLPDFRNLGVHARVLAGVNIVALFFAFLDAASVPEAANRFADIAAPLEPVLFLSLGALYALSPLLARVPYLAGCAAVVLLVPAAAAAVREFWAAFVGEPAGTLARTLVLAAFAAAGFLAYFRLFARAYSPALAEARLQALQARIRPHFLFNSLNAVLGLVRRDPRRAEQALEDLADLFRTLMADARRFVRLADEVALLERYAAIEQLRLGERLRITWELDAAPSDALLPPLVLQPLLENAIYHGIEPGVVPGDVLVRIERRGPRVLVRIENPYVEAHAHRAGNRLALDNIRERLALFFDAEARMEATNDAARYRVEIEMPYKTDVRPAAPAREADARSEAA